MNRPYIVLTVMVVMVGAPLFAAHEALAEVFTITAGNDALLGIDGDDYLKGRGGDDYFNGGGGDDTIEGGSGNDEIFLGEGDEVYAGGGNDLTTRATPTGDYIDYGAGFDRVETIHRDDKTLGNCERALGPRQGDI
jgi:Ca2+-binding RTX toxin-like protein